MKHFLRLLPMLLLFLSAPVAAQKTVQTAVVQTTISCDHCKACETCGDKFQKTLLRKKGIQMVVLDEKAMTITVTYNSKKIDLDKIRTAISNLGYDADNLKADPVAYQKLDNCCKK
ncbi:MAG: heavy-metal-associated domain-containing protein [Proteobacteria bacterium]|nr:MAG: heavy-metal-associated domain-containing protein [Pseudomonadota bacterium]